jgi:hypothetical protein
MEQTTGYLEIMHLLEILMQDGKLKKQLVLSEVLLTLHLRFQLGFLVMVLLLL